MGKTPSHCDGCHGCVEPCGRNEGMDRLDVVIQKLTEMAETLGYVKGHVEKNTADLEEHIRRTNLLETKLDKSEEKWEDKMDEALVPVRWGKTTLKIIAGGGAIAAIVEILTNYL